MGQQGNKAVLAREIVQLVTNVKSKRNQKNINLKVKKTKQNYKDEKKSIILFSVISFINEKSLTK